MSQLHCNKKRRAGQHLTFEDRKVLEYVYNQNLKRARKERKTQKELAEDLGWSASTLCRELKRGSVQQLSPSLEKYQAYSAVVAQSCVQKSWSNKGPQLKIGKDHELASKIEAMLLGKKMETMAPLKYSPTAIVMHFDRQGWPTDTRLCARTIYHYIEQGVFLNVTRQDLPRKGTKSRRRYRRIEKRLRASDYKRIEDRPEAANERTEPGHWEMDCIESVKSDKTCLLTLVDRNSRESYIFKLGSQTQEAVVRKLNGLERKLGAEGFRKRFKTITVDNGVEFQDWQALEKSVLRKGSRTQLYFATAYSSWERGSGENLNGFIRYFIPKGTELKQVRRKEIKELEDFINQYPREILDGLCAQEMHQAAA